MNKSSPSYVVIFDSSLLYGEHNPISSAATDLINKYRGSTKVNIKFLVPQVARDEFKNRYFKTVDKFESQYKTSTSKLKQYMDEKFPTYSVEKAVALEKADECLKNAGIEIIDTPFSKISWEELLKKAAYHESPFEVSEKGFKDAVILETSLLYAKTDGGSAEVIFLFNDEEMDKAVRSFETENKLQNIKVYSSISDFESNLRTHLQKLNQKLIDKIRKSASKVFYDEQDLPNSRFIRWKIEDKIDTVLKERHKSSKVTPEALISAPRRDYLDKGNNEIVIKPSFVKKSDGFYTLESTVYHVRKFKEEGTLLSQTLGADLKYEESTEFTIKWKVKTDSRGTITGDDYVDIQPSNTKTTSITSVRYPRALGEPSTPYLDPYNPKAFGAVSYATSLIGTNDDPGTILNVEPTYTPRAVIEESKNVGEIKLKREKKQIKLK